MILDPFFSPIEEDFAFIRVELLGDEERAADVVPKLVVVKGRGEVGSGVRVPRPSVGIESVILKVFIGGTVEGLRAGLGNDANLRAGCAAVLCGVIRTQYLDLLRGVHICCAEAGAVGARAGSRSTVVGDQILWVPRAVKIRWTLAESEGKVRQRSGASTRHQRGKANRVSPVQLERVNLLTGDQLLHRC